MLEVVTAAHLFVKNSSSKHFMQMSFSTHTYVLAFATACVGKDDRLCGRRRPLVWTKTTACLSQHDRLPLSSQAGMLRTGRSTLISSMVSGTLFDYWGWYTFQFQSTFLLMVFLFHKKKVLFLVHSIQMYYLCNRIKGMHECHLFVFVRRCFSTDLSCLASLSRRKY